MGDREPRARNGPAVPAPPDAHTSGGGRAVRGRARRRRRPRRSRASVIARTTDRLRAAYRPITLRRLRRVARACRRRACPARRPRAGARLCLASTGASPFAVRQPRPPAHAEEAGARRRGREATSSSRTRARASSARSSAARRTSSTSRTGFGRVRGYPLGPGLLGRRAARRPRAAEAGGARRPRCAARRARPTSPARGRGWPARAASTSRASTTPSWSRRSGATTCASRASSSSRCTAWTTCRASCASSARRPGRRLGVLVDHLVTGSKESRIAGQVTGEHALVVGPPVHRHLAGGQAVGRRHQGLADRAQGRGLEDRRLPAAGLGGRHRLRLGAAHPRPRAHLDRPRAAAASAGSRSSSTSSRTP